VPSWPWARPATSPSRRLWRLCCENTRSSASRSRLGGSRPLSPKALGPCQGTEATRGSSSRRRRQRPPHREQEPPAGLVERRARLPEPRSPIEGHDGWIVDCLQGELRRPPIPPQSLCGLKQGCAHLQAGKVSGCAITRQNLDVETPRPELERDGSDNQVPVLGDQDNPATGRLIECGEDFHGDPSRKPAIAIKRPSQVRRLKESDGGLGARVGPHSGEGLGAIG